MTDCKVSQECSRLFNKIFYFDKRTEWSLPVKAFTGKKFKIDSLQSMKIQLNNVKSLLSQFDLNEWSLHTKNRDASSYIKHFLKTKIKPELVTQAWCKFYEILSNFPIMPCEEVFRTLHLCEAPGGFVCALNHYLQLNNPSVQWHWMASTLNPDYEGNSLSEMIPDDRLIKHTRNSWYFGVDLTGDIQKYYNHLGLVTSQQKFSFITADGSVNCMEDPGEQETHVEYLHYCETLTALASLHKGGRFILKIFTIFEDSTVCLLYLLNCLFDEIAVFKPCSSKSGNSEVYVVCTGFVGFDVISPIWEQIISPYIRGNFDTNYSMFSLNDLPESFISQICQISEYFMIKQIAAINMNISSFRNMSSQDIKKVEYMKLSVARYFVKKCELLPIRREHKIIPCNTFITGCWRKTNESFTNNNFNVVHTADLKLKSQRLVLSIKIGKRINYVYSSKFTDSENLKKIMNIYGGTKKPSTLYSYICSKVSNDIIVFNVNDFNLNVYYNYQYEIFTRIVTCTAYSSILFINIPFYTHFLAGLFYLLACSFSSIIFRSGFIYFGDPIAFQLEFLKKSLSEVQEQYRYIDNSIFPADIIQIVKPESFNNNFLDLLHFYHKIW